MKQTQVVGLGAISVILLGAYFVSVVFTIQVIKELICLNASGIIGGTLVTMYIRELSPVVTAIILTGKVASAFTAEIAVMKVTKQLDVMYIMNINPIRYLVAPRLFACCVILPLLNILAFFASLSNSILISALLYKIPIVVFSQSINWPLVIIDCFKSLVKSIIFAIVMSLVSCYFGLTAVSDTKGVGLATTASVVVILMLIFITNFILSLLMF